MDALDEACEIIAPLLKGNGSDAFGEFDALVTRLQTKAKAFAEVGASEFKAWGRLKRDNAGLKTSADTISAYGERGHALAKDIDHAVKLFSRLIETVGSEGNKSSGELRQAGRLLEETRGLATAALNHIRYFAKHAEWLQERFPDATLRDVEGLVKLVAKNMLEATDWSLAPGRYVGVVPHEDDEDFDFEDTMREIHAELADLNAEAVEIAAKIAQNFENLII